jgi:putative transposon-encoded protein
MYVEENRLRMKINENKYILKKEFSIFLEKL